MNLAERLLGAAWRLSKAVNELTFSQPVTHVYNPLDYAWRAHAEYLEKYGRTTKKVVFLGMNPGPWGMAQTGVPFGEVERVRDWMGIRSTVEKPAAEHPKRPIEGFACQRSEVSGKRLWGLFSQRFETPERFFAHHFVANYCPLVFMEASGRNRTPDKLPALEVRPLFEASDRHLIEVVDALQPDWLVGIGAFAEKRARYVLRKGTANVVRILHPSPSSPAANRGWAEIATAQLREIGVW